jgi:hypothetical protein
MDQTSLELIEIHQALLLKCFLLSYLSVSLDRFGGLSLSLCLYVITLKHVGVLPSLFPQLIVNLFYFILFVWLLGSVMLRQDLTVAKADLELVILLPASSE